MRRYWLVTNAGSGSTAPERVARLEADLAAQGRTRVGRTCFPEEPLPSSADLVKADAMTVVLLAGDGTVNAMLTALDGWSGAVLILPGGTMNLLARRLHGNAPVETILARLDATTTPDRIALPYITGDEHRAYAGLILGPATRWVHAREAMRAGRPGRLVRAVGWAWRRTFGQGLRLRNVPALPRAYQAIFVQPGEEAMTLIAVDARHWRRLIDLGWAAIGGDWLRAGGVTQAQAPRFRLASRKPGLALFDGEPRPLASASPITMGRTAAILLATGQSSLATKSSSEGS